MDKIEGVYIMPLKQIEDNRGAVYHVLKDSDKYFNKFAEIYISKINSGITKAWKCHKKMTQNFSVPTGKLKLVIYDARKNSKTFGVINEILLDPFDNYKRVVVPPNVWYGFKCLGNNYCLLLNVTDLKHDPSESISIKLNNNIIPYNF